MKKVSIILGLVYNAVLSVFLYVQSSCWGGGDLLLYFNCLLAVVWLIIFCVSSSWSVIVAFSAHIQAINFIS